jgi:mannose-1-phosphate guanylyltransferase
MAKTQSDISVKVLIMCGGKGTRMWPISNIDHPKQFEGLFGKKSMFAQTITRVLKGFSADDVYIATSASFSQHLKTQAPQIPEKNLILEPAMRDNLGALGLAACVINKRHPNSVMIILWGADHLVLKEGEFMSAIKKAAQLAYKNDVIVHVDTYPTYATVHNGWIKVGDKIKKDDKHKIYEFVRQIEKPNQEVADKLFASGKYLIHTGYMATKPSLLLNYYKQYSQSCYLILQKIQKVIDTDKYQQTLEEEYPKFEKISVDYGLFEKLPPKSQWELPVDMGWVDVGTWELLYYGLDKDENGNVIIGKANLIDVKNSLIIGNDDKVLGVIGIENSIIINSDSGVLVSSLAQASKVKDLYNNLYKA